MGSEMCIRDRARPIWAPGALSGALPGPQYGLDLMGNIWGFGLLAGPIWAPRGPQIGPLGGLFGTPFWASRPQFYSTYSRVLAKSRSGGPPGEALNRPPRGLKIGPILGWI